MAWRTGLEFIALIERASTMSTRGTHQMIAALLTVGMAYCDTGYQEGKVFAWQRVASGEVLQAASSPGLVWCHQDQQSSRGRASVWKSGDDVRAAMLVTALGWGGREACERRWLQAEEPPPKSPLTVLLVSSATTTPPIPPIPPQNTLLPCLI
jgi:hypothetical protein